MRAEPPRGDVELHARRWSADDRIIRLAWKLQEDHALAPAMVEGLEDAARDNDDEAFNLALVKILDRTEELENES